MKAIIPMSGNGSRFIEAGYKMPKPLIPIYDKTMIEWVISTLPECSEYIFICKNEHVYNYPIYDILNKATNNRATIITVDKTTDGAARSCLLAKNLVLGHEEVIIANSDQYVKYNRKNFNILREIDDISGIIFTFNAQDPKWSFVDYNSGSIKRVAEKDPISDIATCGLYYFKRGYWFVYAVEEMIRKNIKTNNEFYLAPCFNQLIEYDHKIIPFYVDEMIGLGTPNDLERFINEK